MKLQIVKDGEIQGSFVATMITVFVFAMFFLGFFIEVVRTGWEKFGATLTTTYLAQLGIWLGYRSAKNIWGSSDIPPQIFPSQVSSPPKLTGIVGPIMVEPKEEKEIDLDKGGT